MCPGLGRGSLLPVRPVVVLAGLDHRLPSPLLLLPLLFLLLGELDSVLFLCPRPCQHLRVRALQLFARTPRLRDSSAKCLSSRRMREQPQLQSRRIRVERSSLGKECQQDVFHSKRRPSLSAADAAPKLPGASRPRPDLCFPSSQGVRRAGRTAFAPLAADPNSVLDRPAPRRSMPTASATAPALTYNERSPPQLVLALPEVGSASLRNAPSAWKVGPTEVECSLRPRPA
mmetsp:Transcript_84120/g.184758  ORF Transcript_84120/g.184758 Transcript_84120/m.184758 type:complete len:230 (-) Transcript_84120:797-1486(-)